MDKFNRRIARIAFWHRITVNLANFDALLKAQGHLTPDDVKALKRIHKALTDCYTSAKERLSVNQDELQRQISLR